MLSTDWVRVQETACYTGFDRYRSRSGIGDLGAGGQSRLKCLNALEANVQPPGMTIRHIGNLQLRPKSEP